MRTVTYSPLLAAGPQSLQPSTPQAVVASLLLRRTLASSSVPLNLGRASVKASRRIFAPSSRLHGARGLLSLVNDSLVIIQTPVLAILLVEEDHARSSRK